jgi:hypothetical protein
MSMVAAMMPPNRMALMTSRLLSCIGCLEG